jgi:hypothetical protein
VKFGSRASRAYFQIPHGIPRQFSSLAFTTTNGTTGLLDFLLAHSIAFKTGNALSTSHDCQDVFLQIVIQPSLGAEKTEIQLPRRNAEETNTMASKRKAAAMAPAVEDPVDPADELLFLCLGGGNEVGRSCHILQYKGKTVMVSFYLRSHLISSTDRGNDSWMQGSMLDMKALLHFHSTMTSI